MDMDFPAVESSHSHDSHRQPAEDTPNGTPKDTPDLSPTSSVSNEKFDESFTDLTQVATTASRAIRPTLSRNITRYTTHGTTYTSDPSFEVDFDDDDAANPRNWSVMYRSVILLAISFTTLIVVLFSTSYTAAIGTMMRDFGIESKALVTLGLTFYLIGLAVGSVVLAPISETFGRKPVYVVSMGIFTILVIPCAVAKNLTTLLVMRFFVAVAGSSMIANAPGSIADIISEENRSIAFSVWSIGPMLAPVWGPIYGGYITEYLSWRWANWIVVMLGGVCFVSMVLIPETYSPRLLQNKAKKMRKETGENRYWSQYDVKVPFGELMRVNLSRPFIMAVREPICIFWNVYIGIIYAILYLCFVAYPIVFTEGRGWSVGNSSLGFVGIGVGLIITISSASPIKKMINAHKPDASGKVPPEATMSVVCIAAVLVPIGELWFAWTCLPASIHPAASIAAGIPFGAGNGIIFIYASNYLVNSYGIYAASALAGNSVIRSILGGVLPLAGPSLYKAMGANWAGTFLGLLEVLIIPVPFVFYRYGHKIREKSTLIRQMREIEEEQERKRRRAEEKARRHGGEPTVVTVKTSSPDGLTQEKEMYVESTAVPVVQITSMNSEMQAQAELSRIQGLRTEVIEEV